MDHSNEVNIIELQENVEQEIPNNTVDHDQMDSIPENPADEDYDEDYLTLPFKTHLKNFIEIPKVDPITRDKITCCSAFGTGFLAAIFFALR